MEVISVGSSSSGNSYIIKTESGVIVLDAGLSCIRITRALEAAGLEASDVERILITHEHIDHVKSVRTLAKKCKNALIYVSRGTYESSDCFCDIDESRLRFIEAGEEAEDSEVRIRAFSLSHDAREPIGFSLISGGEKLSVVTDTGIVTDEIYDEIRDADMLVLEANHDEDLLMYGSYPYQVKLRIKSDLGHLSNRAAGELLASLLAGRQGTSGACDKSGDTCRAALRVMLAHLSFHNNAPFYARRTVEEILSEHGFERDTHYTLTIASKDEPTYLSDIRAEEEF